MPTLLGGNTTCATATLVLQIMHEKFWKEIREDYNRLSRLCRTVDEHLAPLVIISFINNLFFICVQLYNSLKCVGTIFFSANTVVTFAGHVLGWQKPYISSIRLVSF